MIFKTERRRKVLIKVIPIDYPIAEIKDELCTLFYNVHRVSLFKNIRTKLPMPISWHGNDKFKGMISSDIFLRLEVC